MRGGLRLRLTLWNLLVVAGAALLLGVGLVVENQRRAYDRVDRDLWERANAAQRGPIPGNELRLRGFRGDPPNGPPPEGPFGEGFEGGPGGPDHDRPGPGGPMQGGPGFAGPGGGRPPRGPDDPFFRLRRAQYISAAGKVIRPAEDQDPYDAEGVSIAIKSGKSLRTIVLSGSKVRVLTLPREGGGVVQVARELRDVEEFEASLAQTFVWTLPLVLVLGAAGALFLANRALKPVARLAETADQISAADLSRRLPLEGDDEFTRLGQTVNKMIGRLESSFHDLEAVVENQRRFTADASHELRTPLTRLQLAASSALDGNDPALMREALKTVDRASEEMSQLVQQLLTLSRADAGALSIQVSKLDLREPVVLALDELANPRIDASLGEEPVMISGNSDAVRRIAGNLIRNALTYTASESKVRVLITGCSLVVSDDGPGISAEDLPRLGERFFRVDTARASGSGNGLGLAIVKALAEAQGARLEIRSDVGKGSEFSVVFQPSEKESHCWS